MKKYLLVLLPLVAMVILNSCQKINGTYITSPNSGVSATYQPLTAGSKWIYRVDYSATGYTLIDTDAITMGTTTLTINNKQYHTATETRSGFGIADTGYYYTSNHEYSIMQKISAGTSSYAVEMLYLKDNVPVGSTWTASLSYPVIGNVLLNGRITEKGVSKTVAGKTFSDVIHTTIQLTMSASGQAMTFTYEMYVAPNVGIIHIDLRSPGISGVVPQDLISYNIK
ncbi:hypothetical protein [Mucilaginibacter paludis]|nr:hypothetical protein [Mucilaginibacter paludis]